MQIDWIDIAVTILTTGFFSLIGFVWRFSHKVTKLEGEINSIERRVKLLESEHDKVRDRMYSMVKSRSGLVTKESYRHDKEIERALLEAKIKSNNIDLSKDTLK
jgi:hypothetical protein